MSRESFCHNADGSAKGTFLDKRDAKRIARLVATRSSYQSEKGAMHLYHCPKAPVGCGLWHLGHDNDGGFAA